jgi:hypothetical protein
MLKKDTSGATISSTPLVRVIDSGFHKALSIRPCRHGLTFCELATSHPLPLTFFEQKNQLLFLLLTSRGYNFYCLCVIFLKKQYFVTQFCNFWHLSVTKLVECWNGESKVYDSNLCGYKFYDLYIRI